MLKTNQQITLLFSLVLSHSISFADSTMSREEISEFLLTAKIVKVENTKLGITKPKRITLEKNDIQRRAVFKSHTEKIKFLTGSSQKRMLNSADRFENDMAAYELDQILGLNMIPVSVIRKKNNTKGLVQDWVENSIVYKDIYDSKSDALEVCAFNKQTSIMYVFDMLIHNDDRNIGNKLYTLDDCRLWMIDHSRSFRVKNKIPKYMKSVKIRMSEEFAAKLRSLNFDILSAKISDYVQPSQIRALLIRRDVILAAWEKNKRGYLEG